GLVPGTNGVVVQIEKLRDLNASFTNIQRKDCTRSARHAMVLALTANTCLKLKLIRRRKKTRTALVKNEFF
ncbi:MAG: hypothetical protein ACPG8Y_13130, partial [Paracoccaceae bacterium]